MARYVIQSQSWKKSMVLQNSALKNRFLTKPAQGVTPMLHSSKSSVSTESCILIFHLRFNDTEVISHLCIRQLWEKKFYMSNGTKKMCHIHWTQLWKYLLGDGLKKPSRGLNQVMTKMICQGCSAFYHLVNQSDKCYSMEFPRENPPYGLSRDLQRQARWLNNKQNNMLKNST